MPTIQERGLRAKNDKLPALTSLRFVAAFAIVILHCRPVLLPADFLPEWQLDHAVSFFFMLSGFILTYAYPDVPDRRAVARFWLARFARLWPSHIAALLFALAVSPFLITGPGQLIANVFLVQSWIPSTRYFFSYNAVSWSISTEFGFYLLFPLLIANFRTTWALKLAGAATVLIALMAFCQISALDESASIGLVCVNPLGRLFEFVLGMCTALFWQRTRGYIAATALLWTVVEVLTISLALWMLRYGVWIINAEVGSLLRIWPTQIGSCAALAAVVFVMASGQGLIGRAMSWKPFVFLGEISYAMYLLHNSMIQVLAPYLTASGLPSWLTYGAALIALLVLSAALHMLIERPAQTRILKLRQFIFPVRLSAMASRTGQ